MAPRELNKTLLNSGEDPNAAAAGSPVEAASQGAHGDQAARQASRTPAPVHAGTLGDGPCRTPAAPGSSPVPLPPPAAAPDQAQPTPLYVSRSQRQQPEPSALPGADGRGRAPADRGPQLLAAAQESPAVSELVYELRAAPQPRALSYPRAASPGPPDSPSARLRYGQAGLGQAGTAAAFGSVSGALWEQERRLPRAASDLVEFASRSGRASGAEAAEEASALPAYSGFSEEMRAAANAAAEVLLAGASSGSVSFRPGAASASGASASSTRSSASFGAGQAASTYSVTSSACFGADQAVATYSMDRLGGHGRGGVPEGAQELEDYGRAWEHDAACTGSSSIERARLPLEELVRRIQELHGEDEDGGGGNAMVHQRRSADEQPHEHDQLSEGAEEGKRKLAAGQWPDMSMEEVAEVDVEAHIKAACAAGSVTFQKGRGFMEGRGSQSVFAALAQQPQDAQKGPGAAGVPNAHLQVPMTSLMGNSNT